MSAEEGVTEADLLDYDDEEAADEQANETAVEGGEKKNTGAYVSIHSSGFRDFLLKPELMKAIVDCGFEHPSAVQAECIPQAIQRTDVICQAKSGMGKTAVFVLSTLQQLEPTDGELHILVMCHTRELAHQIDAEYKRFTKYMPDVKSMVVFGGIPISANKKEIAEAPPHIVTGTPGRLNALINSGDLKLENLKHFVLDECDKMLDQPDMRGDVQKIFVQTPHDKQVMMFSATLSEEVRPICKKFMHKPMEIYIDDDTKLKLTSLRQNYTKLEDKDKNRKLFGLLDELEFNQVVIFVSSVKRCEALCKLLCDQQFPAVAIYGGGKLKQEERMSRFQEFKSYKKRILVSTDLMGRGIDVERVNLVFNYDMPQDSEHSKASDTYLHRVARAGRFGTKGMAISFVSTEDDATVMNQVQERFEVSIEELPEEIDQSVLKADE